jgi:hypothetical protein
MGGVNDPGVGVKVGGAMVASTGGGRSVGLFSIMAAGDGGFISLLTWVGGN